MRGMARQVRGRTGEGQLGERRVLLERLGERGRARVADLIACGREESGVSRGGWRDGCADVPERPNTVSAVFCSSALASATAPASPI